MTQVYIETNRGNRVQAERSPELTPKELQMWRAVLELGTSATLRSLTATYNCVGHTLAARRAVIDAEHLDSMLSDDGYKSYDDIHSVMEGDLVTYHHPDAPVLTKHVGVVVQVSRSAEIEVLPKVTVLSKWGVEGGEYLHDLADVPPHFGDPDHFWTERKSP